MNELSRFLYRVTSGKWVLLVLAVYLAFNAFVLPYALKQVQNAAGSATVEGFDTQFFYTPEKAFRLVDSYNSAVREHYRNFELTGDIAQPVLYSLLFSLLISLLFRSAFRADSFMRVLNLVPFAAGAADVFENICVVVMLSIYPAHSVVTACFATVFTMSKWVLIGFTVLLVLTGCVKAITVRFHKMSGRNKNKPERHSTKRISKPRNRVRS